MYYFKPEKKRYCALPVHNPDLEEMYMNLRKKALWLEDEIPYEDDLKDWDKLSDGERHFIKHVLSFFSSCFTGDTEILDINGKVIKFKDLVELVKKESVYVFSSSPQGDFEVTRIVDAFISGYSTELVEVKLDNQTSVKCTPDHRFMLRNGEYKKAKDLITGDSLMPLYTKTEFRNGSNRNLIKSNKTEGWTPIYQLSAQHYDCSMSSNINPTSILDTHHIDFNAFNDYPNNLIKLNREEHCSLHSQRSWACPIYQERARIQGAKIFKKLWETDKFRQTVSRIATENITRYNKSDAKRKSTSVLSKLRWENSEFKEKMRIVSRVTAKKTMLKNWESDEYREKIRKALSSEDVLHRANVTRSFTGAKKCIQKGKDAALVYIKLANVLSVEDFLEGVQSTIDINLDLFYRHLNILKTLSNEQIRRMDVIWNKYHNSISDLIEKYNTSKLLSNAITEEDFLAVQMGASSLMYNHKVLSVTMLTLEEPVPVYDLTVESEHHNFPLANGVMVHNSDIILNDNIAINLIQEVPYFEATQFYELQLFNEGIHSRTYARLIETLIKDEAEKHKLFNAIDEVPAVKKKAGWALKWITKGDPVDKLIAFSIVEGLLFSGSFCAIYFMNSQQKLPALSMANRLIVADELQHRDFAIHLYNNYVLPEAKKSNETIKVIINEALAVESEFVTEALPVSLIGMNSDLMNQYLRYVANDLYLRLTGDSIPLYTDKNPFPFMEALALNNKTNFFERRVSEYNVAVTGDIQLTEDF